MDMLFDLKKYWEIHWKAMPKFIEKNSDNLQLSSEVITIPKKLQYPIYIPSLKRANDCLTANLLLKENIDFFIVVEENDYQNYLKNYDKKYLLQLPGNNFGSVTFARNFCKEHSKTTGNKFHWQLDDDIKNITLVHNDKSKKYTPGDLLKLTEQFVNRYSNIAIAGLAYNSFANLCNEPFKLNKAPASCVLVLNETAYIWKDNVIEDTEYALQCLEDNWCTLVIYMFNTVIAQSGTIKGGMIDSAYKVQGKSERAKNLYKYHPNVIRLQNKNNEISAVTCNMQKAFKQTLQLIK